jgi:hypothetical protein
VPDLEGLRFQALHTDDAAQAYRLAVLNPVRGPFNLAAGPVIDARELGDLLGTRVVRVPRAMVRTALAAAWRAHAVPASPHLFDAVLRLPVLDCGRAHDVLGWRPTRTAREALAAFFEGVRHGAGEETAPLTAKQWGWAATRPIPGTVDPRDGPGERLPATDGAPTRPSPPRDHRDRGPQAFASAARAGQSEKVHTRSEHIVIVLGVILLVIGFVTGISVLWTIGIILAVVGLILWIFGGMGHAVAGRRHYW